MKPRREGRSRQAALWLIGLVASGVAAGSALCQEPLPLTDSATVSLVTILPGERVYSLFGHSAIRVQDPLRGFDRTYNWGTFDFGQPLIFVAKFAYGDLRYFLSVQPYARLVDYYWRVEGRAVIEQVLDLDAAQREAVFRFVEHNALPENRYYRYDFYFDNCATRIRDVFETTLGDGLRFFGGDTGQSLRGLLDPYLGERPLLDLAMDLGQGPLADRPATLRDATFLPDYLMDFVGAASLVTDGLERPLVARTDTIVWYPGPAGAARAGRWPALLLWGVFILLGWMTVRDVRSGRDAGRWIDLMLYGLLGLAGLVLLFLVVVSLHDVARRNLNLLWALPTHLVAAAALPGRRGGRWLRAYLLLTAALAMVVLAGRPLWTQEIPGAVVPLLLAVTVRSVGLVLAGGRHRARPAAAVAEGPA